jgi:hypothetical protein
MRSLGRNPAVPLGPQATSMTAAGPSSKRIARTAASPCVPGLTSGTMPQADPWPALATGRGAARRGLDRIRRHCEHLPDPPTAPGARPPGQATAPYRRGPPPLRLGVACAAAVWRRSSASGQAGRAWVARQPLAHNRQAFDTVGSCEIKRLHELFAVTRPSCPRSGRCRRCHRWPGGSRQG